MRNVNNSVETVNAAATAIVTAESRVQPSSVQVISSSNFSDIENVFFFRSVLLDRDSEICSFCLIAVKI